MSKPKVVGMEADEYYVRAQPIRIHQGVVNYTVYVDGQQISVLPMSEWSQEKVQILLKLMRRAAWLQLEIMRDLIDETMDKIESVGEDEDSNQIPLALDSAEYADAADTASDITT